MIKFNNVSYSYSKNRVLDGMSFEITKGGIYGLLGENGSGKSTIIKLLSGLQSPDTGSVEVFGMDAFDKCVSMYEQLFIVPEEFSMSAITFREYIKAHADFYPNFSHKDIENYIEKFHIPATNRLDRMSMGQRKKCLISFCFAANCKVTLLDEPTNGLDIPSKTIFRSIVAEKAIENRAIIISTHQIRDVDTILDSLIVIDHEKMVINSSISRIESRLAFVEKSQATNPIFTEGNISVIENDGTIETPVNIEVLFSAALNKKSIIKQILK